MNASRIFGFFGLLLGLCFVSLAAPASKQPHPATTLRTAEQFAQLKPGDKIAYVCKQCDSVQVQTIESKEQAMALCKEGEAVSCPSCQKKFKATFRGPRAKAGKPMEVSYVNEKGEECMFVAKLGADDR